MKELTIEEKAERYDKAIEKAKIYTSSDYPIEVVQDVVTDIFPELKESEDERIRKNFITFFKEEYGTNSNARFAGIKVKDVIAWLEKQGEQKDSVVDFKAKDWYVSKVDGKIHKIEHSVDKVEPKFKVGDWVVNILGEAWHIDSIDKKNYQVSDGKGNYNYFPISVQDEMRHWAIEDARNGDVLTSGNAIFIFNMIHDGWINCHCSFHKDGSFIVRNYDLVTIKYAKEVFPTTKEQRDTLFKAMADAGYEFDFEKKELKKID